MSRAPQTVYALVDWDNITRHFAPLFHKQPKKTLPNGILALQQRLADVLKYVGPANRYRVTIRIYHGWHHERQATPHRGVFETLSFSEDFARNLGGISFRAGFEFGNELTCGEGPLFHTVRDAGQKMVDTAICCDVLHCLHAGVADLVVVVSDDDDIVPAVLTASSWGKRVLLLRPGGESLEKILDAPREHLVRH